MLFLVLIPKIKKLKIFQDFYWIQSWTLHTAKSRVKFGAFSQNIKTVSTGGIEEKPASPVNPSCLQVSPFLLILVSGLRKQGH